MQCSFNMNKDLPLMQSEEQKQRIFFMFTVNESFSSNFIP